MGQLVDEVITLIALGDSRHPQDWRPMGDSLSDKHVADRLEAQSRPVRVLALCRPEVRR